MTRRLLNLVTVLSLLLCVAVVALWARSYSRADYLVPTDGAPYLSVARGDLRIAFRGGWLDENGNHVFSMPAEFAGEISSLQSVHIPLWIIASAAAVTCLASYCLSYATLRRGDGLCPSCGYSLTGNVSGVCPECGRAST
jgi:hypothetical protein